MLSPRTTKILKTIIPLALGFGLIAYSYWSTTEEDRTQIAFYISKAPPLWILLSVLIGIASHVSRAIRWNYLLDPLGYQPKLQSNVMIILMAYLANLGIPRSGEVLRATALTTYEKVPFEKGFGTIVTERLIDLIMLFIIIGIAMLLQTQVILDYLDQQGLGLFAGLGILLAGILGLWLGIRVLRTSQSGFAFRIRTFLDGLMSGITSVFKMKNKGLFLGHTFFIWFAYIAMFWVIKYTIPETQDLQLSQILVAFVAGAFAMTTTNGGIGLYPIAVSGALGLYGIDPVSGNAFGWIMWIAQTLMVVVFGAISFLLLPLLHRNPVGQAEVSFMKHLTFILTLFLMGQAFAQSTVESFESYYLQEERNIRISLPENYDAEKTYPLILVLDAEYLFDMVVANARFYHNSARMPSSIIIGVDHQDEYLRERDFSFDEESGYLTSESDAYYSFLEKELLPYCEKQFSIAPFKMFIGYDRTAALGNFFLYGERSPFTAYLSISPVMPTDMENLVPSRLLDHSQQLFYNLVLEKEPTPDRQRILQLNQSIASIQRKGLHYYFDQYESPDHTTVVAYGISKAFDNVFKLFRPITPMEYKKEILTSNEPVIEYLFNKYGMIEELLGFKKPYELNDVMAIYAASRKKEDFESLKELAEICKKQWPESMIGYFFQAEYFEYMGEVKKALRAFEKAYQKEEIDFLTKELAYDKIASIKDDFGY